MMNSSTRNIFIIIILVALGAALVRSYILLPTPENTDSAPQPNLGATTLQRTYQLTSNSFSLEYPAEFSVDEQYVNRSMGPGYEIKGVKFTIPGTMAQGTNLSSDSSISIEELPDAQICTPTQFLSQTPTNTQTITDNNTMYSVGSTSDAGAGNRYEETIYIPNNNDSCIAIRYFVHYAVYENFEPGTVTEFDKQSLINQFDEIRRTLTIKQ